MIVQRAERFDTDLERQFRWYLMETDLDVVDALALATRFAKAVDTALEFLRQNPEIGRRRFRTYPDLSGTRSWKIGKPFHRFVIFYRIEAGTLFAERLLERTPPAGWRALKQRLPLAKLPFLFGQTG